VRGVSSPWPRAALLAAAALLFTANASRLSLPSLDDCFYARKGVEMARSGNLATVTWNGNATFQNPPLQIWILARAFQLFGKNDLAARLPSILMALGLLLGVLTIGRRLWGDPEAETAAALLLLSPFFVNHARRAMLDMPLAFWVVLAMLAIILGRTDPRRLMLVSVPLGAAILTKSVLGLLPLFVVAGAVLIDGELRASVRNRWLLAGVALGLAIGASWPVQQWLAHGPRAVEEHFVTEIAARSTAGGFDVRRLLLGYPAALLGSYQPVILLAVCALPALVRRGAPPGSRLIAAWFVVPIALYSLSSARSPRYLFPTLPAMALAGGFWLARAYPRVASAIRTGAPIVALLGTGIFWVSPQLLARSGNDPLKSGSELTGRVPAPEGIPYLGSRYWGFANPILYYQERYLEPSSASAEAAVALARSRSRVLFVDRDRVADVESVAAVTRVFEQGDGLLLELRQ
jgi:4-amino-4-deoxy-L-arabinose transferase-like glycosyltransferase